MKIHGMCYTRTFRAWWDMHQRCSNPNACEYHNYGARGITVCLEWTSFTNFYADMGEKPDNKSLGRIDNAKGYGPDNCRWETKKEQNNNTRRCVLLTHEGKTFSLTLWSEKVGISPITLRSRIRNGWPVAQALTTPAFSNPTANAYRGWETRRAK